MHYHSISCGAAVLVAAMLPIIGCAGNASAPADNPTATTTATDAPPPPLAEFDTLWNHSDPAGTRAKFEALLDQASDESPFNWYLQICTQVARTQGLEGEFETARATLAEVENRRLVAPDNVPEVVRVRYLLELGRTWNSAGETPKAVPLFLDAWELAKRENEHYLAVDAAHMLAIATTGNDSINWNRRAMQYAEDSGDDRAQGWLGALYNNMGWTYHDMSRYAQALEMWEKGLAFRTKRKHAPETIWVADWSVARAHRSLGRHDDALTRLRRIDAARQKAGAPDGYVYEEIGENLWAQGKQDDARPWFAKAFGELSKDRWLPANEPARLSRLRELSHKAD